jgi:hypothetical protein
MAKAADGTLRDVPSKGEIELFRKAETRFQPIFVVMNIAHLKTEGETHTAFPYALTLIPASKRGGIDVKTIDLIATLGRQINKHWHWVFCRPIRFGGADRCSVKVKI